MSPEIDFRNHGAHAEGELVIWEGIATTLEAYLSHKPSVDRATRKEIFSVLLGASTGVEEFEDIHHLSVQQIKHLIVQFRG